MNVIDKDSSIKPVTCIRNKKLNGNSNDTFHAVESTALCHPRSSKSSEIPRFKFFTAPNLFKLMWKEYTVPYCNKLCAKDMNQKYGAKWRNSLKVAKMYARRKVIYRAVERGIARGIPEAECLQTLEDALVSSKLSRTQFMNKNKVPDKLR